MEDQPVFAHHQYRFVLPSLEPGILLRADHGEPVLERRDQLLEPAECKAQQAQGLDAEMALHRTEIAAFADAFEGEHQPAGGGLIGHIGDIAVDYARRRKIVSPGAEAIVDPAEPLFEMLGW